MQNKIPQQTVWDEPGNSGSISGCALTNPLPVCSHLASSWDQDFPGHGWVWVLTKTPLTFLAPGNAGSSVKSLNLIKTNTEL